MANEISLVTASGRTVTPKDDGIIYEVFSPGNGIIYGGAVTIKDSSTLHITAGHGIVCGRKFTIDDSDIPVALSGSGSLLGRLYIHLDLADAADPITLLVETGASLTPVVQDADVNINNGVYEINIATFDVDTTTISNLVDVAPYLNTNGYEHEQINNKIGDTDISGIGDGTATGAISALNADIAKLSEVVSVTANGTETYAQLLTRLNGVIDRSKVTPRAVVYIQGMNIFLNLLSINSIGYIMGTAMIVNSLPYNAGTYIYSNGSMFSVYSNGSYTDFSSEVATGTIIFYY